MTALLHALMNTKGAPLLLAIDIVALGWFFHSLLRFLS